MSKRQERTNVSLSDDEKKLLKQAALLTGDRGYTAFMRRVALAEAREVIAAASEPRSGATGKSSQTSRG